MSPFSAVHTVQKFPARMQQWAVAREYPEVNDQALVAFPVLTCESSSHNEHINASVPSAYIPEIEFMFLSP
jgi:hypothetical protein